MKDKNRKGCQIIEVTQAYNIMDRFQSIYNIKDGLKPIFGNLKDFRFKYKLAQNTKKYKKN